MPGMAQLFRGLVAGVMLGVFLHATAAPAPKEPVVGATVDAVIRTHGRPKGQIASGTREIWTYDRFRVMFEHGRVRSVTPIEPGRVEQGGGISPSPAVPVVGSSGPATKSPATYPLTVTLGNPSVPSGSKAAPPPAQPARTVAKPAAPATGGVMKFALVVMFGALALAIGVVLWAHSRVRSLEDETTAQKLSARNRPSDGHS